MPRYVIRVRPPHNPIVRRFVHCGMTLEDLDYNFTTKDEEALLFSTFAEAKKMLNRCENLRSNYDYEFEIMKQQRTHKWEYDYSPFE